MVQKSGYFSRSAPANERDLALIKHDDRLSRSTARCAVSPA